MGHRLAFNADQRAFRQPLGQGAKLQRVSQHFVAHHGDQARALAVLVREQQRLAVLQKAAVDRNDFLAGWKLIRKGLGVQNRDQACRLARAQNFGL